MKQSHKRPEESGRTHSPELAGFARAGATDLSENDNLYDAARAMLDRWDEARALRSEYNAKVNAEDTFGGGMDARARMEHIGRVHAAVAATVDAFDEFMQLVAEGPEDDAPASDSLLGLYARDVSGEDTPPSPPSA